ncbi:MAG: non-ribosomal peptide synthetase, partial [bacterium]|nr:non-ribosomal peptide synthetase [bacterium]
MAVSGPRHALTPEVRAELTAHKPELLEWLHAVGEPVAAAAPIERADRSGSLPLSFGQEQVWIIEQLAPGNGAYHIPMALAVRGDLQIDPLRRAVRTLVDRHEIFRTTIGEHGGVPYQRIDAGAQAELCVVPAAETAGDIDLDDRIRSEIQRPFDLEAGPLVRVTLFQRNPESVLLFAIHHTAGDGWSLGVLRRELFALYEAYAEGREPTLESPPIQYADYAVWQRARWDAGALAPSLAYWREQLSGLPEALDLPTDRPGHIQRSFQGSRVDVGIPDETYRRFTAGCRDEGASFFMGALAAFQLLLYRFTGQDDLSVGTPIALRGHRETEGLIGNFTNPLVLRTSLAGTPSCRELIRRTRETALAAFEHADLPFEKLVEELHPGRDTSRNPLFQVFFVLEPPSDSIDAAGLEISRYAVDSGRSQLDLTLTLQEPGPGETGVRGELSYDTELFDRSTIARLARYFERIVEAIASAPETGIDAV